MSVRDAVSLGVWLSVFALSSEAQSSALVDFSQQVHPIFAAKCLSCHSDQKRSGAFSLATHAGVLEGGRTGAAIKPGNSAESLLVRRLTGEIQPRMPLGKEPLSGDEIAVIRAWIDQGARATPASVSATAKWEAPLALNRPATPPPVWSGWDAPIDRYVSAYLAAHKIAPSAPVSARVFARRVYLDVVGLLPSPSQLQAFVQDRDPAKRRKLVEKLLSENQDYAENWISFWNDLLRNDEGVGYAGSRKSITDWLLPALQTNRPYNEIVTRLLNPASKDDPDGFLVGVNWRGDINASQTAYMQAAQNSAQIFLGINLKCNSCHDSFISKWKLKDAYSLAAYFSPDPKLELYRCDAATAQFAEPGFLFPELNRTAASGSIADRRAAIAATITDPRDGRLPRTLVNRFWQRLFGRGLVELPDEMDGEPWSPVLLDWLASDFVEHGYDLKYLLATILTSRAYEMPSVSRPGSPPRDYVFQGPEVRRLTAEQFGDAVGAITGEWHVYQPQAAKIGAYSREWRLASSPLTRGLGRPIRDQVISTRESEATTLQALELINGETLTHWLTRGSKKMLGELPPEPAAVFDSGSVRMKGSGVEIDPVAFDVDVSKAKKIWLLVEDVDSYEPEHVEAVWAQAEFASADGAITKLSALQPTDGAGLRIAQGPIELNGVPTDGVRASTPSRLVYDLSGMGFTRFRGKVTLEKGCLRDDIQPKIRFFVFEDEPNLERLVSVAAATPVPAEQPLKARTQVVDRIFWFALGRAPSPRERRTAENALSDPAHPANPAAAGVADLLWAVLMMPEFQLIL